VVVVVVKFSLSLLQALEDLVVVGMQTIAKLVQQVQMVLVVVVVVEVLVTHIRTEVQVAQGLSSSLILPVY
jgi:hypothetical protein